MKESILVIDDELGIRQGCRRALVPEGYNVDTAVSLEEGKRLIESGHYDLVLLDVMLPDGRGLDLLGPIHERDAETVAIIITGYATVELAVEAIKRGAYDFISKPFTADLLLITVNQALEKRRLSLETARLQAIEQEAKELEELGEFKTRFTYLVAHELRAPIGGAQSLLRALTRGMAGELTTKQREILLRVEARLDMLLSLVNDLLDLAATKTIGVEKALEPVSLPAILQPVLDRLAVEAEHKQVSLRANIAPRLAPVFATPEGLEQIFNNLVGNAIKYTPPGGEVHVDAWMGSDGVLVTVSDTGIGIPAADLPHIWEEFYRAQNARTPEHTGTGLGLSIVKQLVDSFGGSVEVESEEGQGTQFKLRLAPVAVKQVR